MPRHREGLRCTFLAVGHGCATVIELPNGQTFLFDAGSLYGERTAQQRVENALWERGIGDIDAVLISHADVDHFNAVPGLLTTFPTGTLLTSRAFLDFDQPSVRAMCDAAANERVPMRLIEGESRLALDEDVQLTILHPGRQFHSDDDNANSIVLLIEYAGQRILLTGDLEEEGMNALLAGTPVAADVLLSPHHGSRAANPPRLAEWSGHPKLVIVSTGNTNLASPLEAIYGDGSRVISTADCGAVCVEISPQGELRESHFLQRETARD